MSTQQLYYQDCHIRSFSAQVLSCTPADGGYHVTLDRTAFYPEGGGQACDRGTLGEAQVLDVQEKASQVIHLCDRPLQVGDTVTGTLDWQRRLDQMQQHTGEHILSGLIHARYGYNNSGFHVGQGVMEVDFDGPIPPEALAELEEQANRIVWENLPVQCSYPAPEELKQIPYRTKRELPWPVRIVQIPGVDSCACCGVHVAYTGEVGLIKLISCVKFHGGVRLEMVCGGRAYAYIRNIFEQNRQISQLLSAKMPQTAEAVQKLFDSYGAEKFRSTNLERQIFQAIADSYQGRQHVLHYRPELTGGGVRELADRIGNAVSGVAVVVSGTEEKGYSLCLISRSMDVRELGQQAMAALNGRGGGKSDAFQGTVRSGFPQIRQFFQQALPELSE